MIWSGNGGHHPQPCPAPGAAAGGGYCAGACSAPEDRLLQGAGDGGQVAMLGGWVVG